MITYVRFRIISGQIELFQNSFKGVINELNVLPECEEAELAQCEAEQENYILRVKWRNDVSPDDMVKNTINLNTQFDSIMRYKEDILEMRNYRPI